MLISWNIEALALYHVEEIAPTLIDGLTDFLELAAASIAQGQTPDPANVSPPIKLPEGISQHQAYRRLSFFAGCAAAAQEQRYSADAALAALGRLFPKQLPEAPTSSKDSLARALAVGNTTAAVTERFSRPLVKSPRAYGDAAA